MNDLKERFERETRGLHVSTDGLERTFKRVQRRSRNRRIGSAVVVLLVAGAAIGALVQSFSSNTIPASDPRSPFLGTWFSIDGDGSAQTMGVRAPEGEAVEIVVQDEFASVCSGAPSTMTGTGRLEGARELVIPAPLLTCDDGSEPEALSGPPLEEHLRNLTFVHDPQADTLTDSFGLVWDRDAEEDPGPALQSGGMWPQTSLGEINEAQEGADAGDPRYTWQVDPNLAAQGEPFDAEIFARFLREELGWEEFLGVNLMGYTVLKNSYDDIRFVRCAPGRTNPLYPNDPQAGGCAPTIDERHYETVDIDLAQLARKGPSGIWVVTRWTMQPAPDADVITPFYDFAERQIEQVAPPTDAEVTGFLDAFVQARIDGEGAEGYLHPLPWYTPVGEIPLLYATSSGAPYERYEIERLEGPAWPHGYLMFKLRLFAEGGNTVVEQTFYLYRDGDGRLGLNDFGERTTENGKVVPEPSSILDGQVTYAVPSDWGELSNLPEMGYLRGGRVPGDPRRAAIIEILPNPLPPDDCDTSGDTPPSAEELVRAIRSDPDLETTPPVTARVGGIDALRLDVAAVPGAETCVDSAVQVAPSHFPYSEGSGVLSPGRLGRLYVLDVPAGIRVPAESGPGEPVRTLAIWITALAEDFDRDVKTAAPIVDSIEFHPR